MNVLDLLKKTRIEVSPETFNVISLKEEEWLRFLETSEQSPRMTVPFMIFKDKWEVTLVLDEIDFKTVSPFFDEIKVEKGFRLLSFDVALDFDVVGFMAQISKILAEAGISILPISSFSRDHILLRQEDLPTALKALRGFVEEVC